jgi:hypothetical protein
MTMQTLKTDIIRADETYGDYGHESAETQADYEQQISDRVAHYPGCAVQVYSGWVWSLRFGDEQRWSRRSTKHECERVVYQVVERLGIEEAFSS